MKQVALFIAMACSLAWADQTNVYFYEPTNGSTLFNQALPIDIYRGSVFWDLCGVNPTAFSSWLVANGAENKPRVAIRQPNRRGLSIKTTDRYFSTGQTTTSYYRIAMFSILARLIFLFFAGSSR